MPLTRSEIATIAEDGEQVMSDGLGEFRVRARWWPEVSCVTRPMFGIFENNKLADVSGIQSKAGVVCGNHRSFGPDNIEIACL